MFTLKIPEPCHEDWSKMTRADKGRFCGACQKIVVDFTGMSDEEVKNYLLQNRNQSTCGRFYASQIGRPLENQTVTLNPEWYQTLPFPRQLFYAIALFFVLGVQSCNWETSKGAPSLTVQQHTVPDTLTAGTALTGEPAIDEDTGNKKKPPVIKQIIHLEPVLKGDVQVLPDTVVEPEEPMMGGVEMLLPEINKMDSTKKEK